MQKLYKLTPLQDSYSCNFNILVHGYPKVMGVYDILKEWTEFRTGCVKRRIEFDLEKKQAKLHLLKALGKILLDIDKAIKIIRETEEENEVVPNLMIGFGIDEVQAEYIAEIKLRHLNREYIMKRLDETDALEKEIAELSDTLGSDKKIRNIIISELKEVSKKYGQPRRTQFFYKNDIEEVEIEDETPDYQCTLFISQSGYFKKIAPQSLRMSSEHKLKEGDFINQEIEASNKTDLLFFTDKCQVYKSRLRLSIIQKPAIWVTIFLLSCHLTKAKALCIWFRLYAMRDICFLFLKTEKPQRYRLKHMKQKRTAKS